MRSAADSFGQTQNANRAGGRARGVIDDTERAILVHVDGEGDEVPGVFLTRSTDRGHDRFASKDALHEIDMGLGSCLQVMNHQPAEEELSGHTGWRIDQSVWPRLKVGVNRSKLAHAVTELRLGGLPCHEIESPAMQHGVETVERNPTKGRFLDRRRSSGRWHGTPLKEPIENDLVTLFECVHEM